LTITTSFYWDLNDETRAFAERFAKRNGDKYPNMINAGVYSSVLHYLEAVKQVGSAADGAKVVATMKATKWNDSLFGPTTLRVDGRAVHTTYLVEVKKPEESKRPYDYYKILEVIPPDQSFRPLADEKGVCPLVQ
jgi:branched-chain amino acid transport system substrate-binding protein